MMLWTEKYSPKSLSSFCGNRTAVTRVKTWALDFERGNAGRPLLVWGPPGVGKSALCNAVALEMGWEPVFMTSSDLRNRESIERIAGIASTSGSLTGRRKFIVIEDIDAMSGKEDRGGIGAVAGILRSASNPVIATAENYWDQKLSSLRTLYSEIPLRRISEASLVPLLERILKLEGVGYPEEVVKAVAQISNGDIRSAINDLQAVAEGRSEISLENLGILQKRDREQDIWEGGRALLKSTGYTEALQIAREIDVEPDYLAKFLEENVPREYEEIGDVSRAFEALSRADVFSGRIIARQHWGFMRYSTALASAGVALAKEKPYHGYKKYSAPSVIMRLSRNRSERQHLKQIGAKIGAQCHTSIKEARIFIPLVRMLLEKNPAGTADYFGFGVEEVAFLLGKSESQAEKMLEGVVKKEKRAKPKPGKRKMAEDLGRF